jgi:two-component system, OmpR family, sensor histidine kinase SenX3
VPHPREFAVAVHNVVAVIELGPGGIAAVVLGVLLLVAIAVGLGVRAGRSRRRSTEAGRERDGQSALLRRALDGAPLGVVVGDGSGERLFANAAARRFIEGRHAETIVQSRVADLLAEGVRGEHVTDTLDLYGPPRWSLVLRGQPLSLDDVAGAMVVIEDVTERRRLEAVRRDFVANISHELKTPVGALSVLSETLTDESEPEVLNRLAGRIQDEAFRVNRLIDDLLELSRIEAEEFGAREPVPIELILREAIDRTRPAAHSRHIDIKVDDAAEGAAVFGDRRQLVSAVANLIDNALKYSDPGSQVEIRTREGEASVEIEVEDHGIGIPARDLDRIFERFYRVDRARSRATGGTGLGLAIVRHVANNHDGRVRVQSREGDGSTFTFVLPTGARFESSHVEAS